MATHEPKYCPRCGCLFECKLGDVANCQCSEVQVSQAVRRILEQSHWNDCLCKHCLARLEDLSRQAARYPAAVKGMPLIEGVHYYKEGNFWVFTELYHLQRGYCCRSGCRHCAYGFKKPN